MEAIRYVVKMSKKDDVYNLMPLGDLHWGNPNCDRAKILECLKLIENEPNYLTIGMGDYFENNSLEGRGGGLNKHFDKEALLKSPAPFIEDEMEQLLPEWKRIANKTIGMHIGNHEDRTLTHKRFRKDVCAPLQEGQNRELYLGDFAMIALTFSYRGTVVNEYVIVSAHGSKFGGQRPGTVLTAAHNKFSAYDFDVALFGHTHFANVTKIKTGWLDTKAESPQYMERKRFICNTGSFVHSHKLGFDAYTDKSFGSLRDVGTITVTFDPFGDRLNAHA